MSSQALMRLGGLGVILAAILLLSGSLLRYAGNASLGQPLYFAAFVALPFALVALYAGQAHRTGVLAFAGWVLSTLGAALSVVPAFLLLAAVSGASEAHAVLMFSFSAIPVLPIGQYAYVLGQILFGMATVRAGVYPRWTGAALGIGVVLAAAGDYLLVLWPLGVVVGTLGFARIGWLFISQPQAAPTALPASSDARPEPGLSVARPELGVKA